MGEWNATQLDALVEHINIGFGRAAAALSALVSRRVLLRVPQAYVLIPGQASERLHDILPPDVFAVQQDFQGRFFGKAYLLFSHEHAAALVDLLLGGHGALRQLTTSDHEAMLEIGNIVLNSFLGTLGNLVGMRLRYSMPQICQASLSALLHLWLEELPSGNYVVLVHTHFTISQVETSGYLLVLLDTVALDVLQQAMSV
ncbi:MAG: hypothetical protein D6755_03485 [Anaerolineae bacterium]|nr:MAG: hypothetical protein D6755_03485 [Anaerolineae bacterium]